MTTASTAAGDGTADGDPRDPETADVVVVGAGFSGLHALYRLRQLGLRIVCLEAGDGVGGTWYWNRYPGARVDIESMQYSYSFDDELQQEWRWPEYFSPQADLEAYANHVADRFGLRDLIRFGARVNRLRFDERTSHWHVSTERGDQITAKYVVAASGALDATNIPDFPGLSSFRGQWHHTSQWPRQGVSFAGQRVGLIGTGSTGLQAATAIGKSAEHLYVFQRTPAYSLPANNRPLPAGYEQEWKEHYPQRRAEMRQNFAAGYLPVPQYGSVFDYTPEERTRILEQAWEQRNGLLFLRTFTDTMKTLEANEVTAEFVRGKIRQLVKDADYEAAFNVYGRRNGYSFPSFDQIGRYAIGGDAAPKLFADAMKMIGGGESGAPATEPAYAELAAASMVTEPAEGATITNTMPTIRANLATMGAIDPGSVKMRISGVGPVPAKYDPATKIVTYTIVTPLAKDTYYVFLTATLNGKLAETKWSFNVDPAAKSSGVDTSLPAKNP